MSIKISKSNSTKLLKNIRKRKNSANNNSRKLKEFFGKLPSIEDGLTFQKKVRREWK